MTHIVTASVSFELLYLLLYCLGCVKRRSPLEPDLEVQMAHRWATPNIAVKHDPGTWTAGLGSKLVPAAVGLVSLLVTELMHHWLVPDLGRLRERLLAEGLSAIVVALLTAGFIYQANQRRTAALLRMQIIAEMNHHIRNALAAISLSTDAIKNQQSIQVICDSVDRIEWALREILPRSQPLPEEDQYRMFYFEACRQKGSTRSDVDTVR